MRMQIFRFLSFLILLTVLVMNSSRLTADDSATSVDRPDKSDLINDSLAAFLNGDWEAVLNFYYDIRQSDHDNDSEALELSDNLAWLYSCMTSDRVIFLKRLEMVRSEREDDFLKRCLRNHYQNDEKILTKRLILENLYNHSTNILNHISASVGALAQGRTQPLFQLPLDIFFSWKKYLEISPRQKKSLFLTKRFNKKYPDASGVDKRKELIRKLSRKKSKQIRKRETSYGVYYEKRRNLVRARFHYNNALEALPNNSPSLKRKIEGLKSRLAGKYRDRSECLTVLKGEDFFQNPGESEDYHNLIYSSLKDDKENFNRQVMHFMKNHPSSNYIDDALYVSAGMENIRKDRKEVFRRFRRLTLNYPDSNAAWLASSYLESPEFNLLKDFKTEEKQYHNETLHYILTGKREREDQLYIAAGAVTGAPSRAAENLGLVFIIDVAVRGVKTLFNNPVPSEDVKSAAARFLRFHPDDSLTMEIDKYLVDLYRKEGDYYNAIKYAEKEAVLPEKEMYELKGRQARKMFTLIKQSPDSPLKKERLVRLIEEYPEASIIPLAKKELHRLLEDDIYEFKISKDLITSYPELWTEISSEINPAFLDDNPDNGEMTPEGIAALEGGPVIYRLENENSSREIQLTSGRRKKINHIMKTVFSEDMIKEAKETEKIFPVEISAGIGGGVDVHPSFLKIPYDADDLALFR